MNTCDCGALIPRLSTRCEECKRPAHVQPTTPDDDTPDGFAEYLREE